MYNKILNPQLYNAIKEAFGSKIRITNEGEIAKVVVPVTLPALGENLIKLRTADTKGGEQYLINCPYCGDTRGRLQISYLYDAKFEAGEYVYKASEYLALCFNEDCLSNRKFQWDFQQRLRPLIGNQPLQAVEMLEEDVAFISDLENQVPWPGDAWRIDSPRCPKEVVEYLQGRGFDMGELINLGVSGGHVEKFNCPAMIAPVWQYGKYWFYQARQTVDPLEINTYTGKEKPKYDFGTGAKKSWALYNLDFAKSCKRVVLVEGITDVWKVGQCAMATFGKKVGPAQLKVLRDHFRDAEVIKIPDMNDPKAIDVAEKEQFEWIAGGYFKKTRLVRLPEGKDPGGMTRSEIWDYIEG